MLGRAGKSGEWKQDLQLIPLYFSCLHTPGEAFVYPRVGLPPVKTTSLKDAKMVLGVTSDRCPFMQVGLDISRTSLNGFESLLGVNPDK